MTGNIHNKLNLVALLAMVALTVMYYHPAFLSFDNEEAGSSLSRYVLMMSGVLFVLNINFQTWAQSRYIKVYVSFLIVVAIIGVLLYFFEISETYKDQIRQLLLPLIFFAIGYNMNLSYKHLRLVCMAFIICAIYMGVSQVLTNIGSFAIVAQYLVSAKNCISGIFSIGIVLSFGFMINREESKPFRLFCAICFIMLLVVLVTIRGRSGMLASFCTCFAMYLTKARREGIKNIAKKAVIAVVLAVVAFFIFGSAFDFIGSYVYDSIFTENSTGDITSGRTERNIMAIRVILDAPLTGRMAHLEEYDTIGWVHNYFLLVLSDYGLIFGGILVALYVYLIKTVLKGCHNKSTASLSNAGYWTMVILLIISLFEPTYPYSPGTVTFFPFFLLGVSIHQDSSLT